MKTISISENVDYDIFDNLIEKNKKRGLKKNISIKKFSKKNGNKLEFNSKENENKNLKDEKYYKFYNFI